MRQSLVMKNELDEQTDWTKCRLGCRCFLLLCHPHWLLTHTHTHTHTHTWQTLNSTCCLSSSFVSAASFKVKCEQSFVITCEITIYQFLFFGLLNVVPLFPPYLSFSTSTDEWRRRFRNDETSALPPGSSKTVQTGHECFAGTCQPFPSPFF